MVAARTAFVRIGLSLLCTASLAVVCQSKDEPASLEVSPQQLKLKLGESKALSSKLKGREGAVQWALDGARLGNVTSNGVYHAPTQATTPATVRVIATVPGKPELKAETVVFLEPVSVEVKPRSAELQLNRTVQLSAKVDGAANQQVIWSIQGGAGAGQITPGGLFTAPQVFQTPGTVVVQAASAADPSKTATATLRIEPVSISISPTEVQLKHGDNRKFVAKVNGTPLPEVLWSVDGENLGSVSPQGVYTTPPAMTTPTVVTVIARAAGDPSKQAIARVRVEGIEVVTGQRARQAPRPQRRSPLARIARTAYRITTPRVVRLFMPFDPVDLFVKGPRFEGKTGKLYVPLGASLPLEAAVLNTSDDRTEWKLEGSSVGDVSEDGLYQAPEKAATPQVVQVRVTSAADPSKSALFTLNIPAVVVRADEKKENKCLLHGVVQLAATVENTENDKIVWSVEGGDAFGAVSATGQYRSPSSISTPATVRVRAASEADPTKFALIAVQIPAVSLDLSPDSTELKPGGSVRFKARARGSAADGTAEVEWKLTPPIGTISPDGVYQAPVDGGAQVVQVTASLKGDPTRTATASIKLKGK